MGWLDHSERREMPEGSRGILAPEGFNPATLLQNIIGGFDASVDQQTYSYNPGDSVLSNGWDCIAGPLGNLSGVNASGGGSAVTYENTNIPRGAFKFTGSGSTGTVMKSPVTAGITDWTSATGSRKRVYIAGFLPPGYAYADTLFSFGANSSAHYARISFTTSENIRLFTPTGNALINAAGLLNNKIAIYTAVIYEGANNGKLAINDGADSPIAAAITGAAQNGITICGSETTTPNSCLSAEISECWIAEEQTALIHAAMIAGLKTRYGIA